MAGCATARPSPRCQRADELSEGGAGSHGCRPRSSPICTCRLRACRRAWFSPAGAWYGAVMSNPTFIEVQKYLRGVDYPADRDTLIEHAQHQGAPGEVVDALRSLDDRTYDAPNDISEQV